VAGASVAGASVIAGSSVAAVGVAPPQLASSSETTETTVHIRNIFFIKLLLRNCAKYVAYIYLQTKFLALDHLLS
jgi:hypothetical protein